MRHVIYMYVCDMQSTLMDILRRYGTVKELFLMRQKNSAFVKFAHQSEAEEAIAGLNQRVCCVCSGHVQCILENQKTPLTVKWSESEEERAQRKSINFVDPTMMIQAPLVRYAAHAYVDYGHHMPYVALLTVLMQ